MPVSSKILVKVGKKSNIKFRSAIAYRAITMDELESLANKYPDASIVVIENILQSEDSTRVKKFIERFEGNNTKNKVFFYVENNDNVTCGIADELAYDIYMNISDLYKAIKLNCGISVSTDLSLSSEFIGNEIDDIFDDSFQDALDTINTSNNSSKDTLPEIESKDDAYEFDTSIIEEHIEESLKSKDDNVNNESYTSNGEDNNIEHKDEHLNNNEKDNTTKLDQKAIEELEDAKRRLAESNKEIVQLKRQLHDAFEKTKSTMLLVKAVENERDAFKDRAKQLDESEILEQPITLQVYKKLKDRVSELEQLNNEAAISNLAIKESENKLNQALSEKEMIEKQLLEYKERLRESSVKLSSSNSKVVERETEVGLLKKQIESLENQIKDLESQIETGNNTSVELQSAVSDLAIKDAVISDLKSQISKNESVIAELRKAINELENTKSDLKIKINSEEEAREFIMKALSNAVSIVKNLDKNIDEAYSREDQLNDAIKSLTDSNNQKEKTIIDLNSRINNLIKSSEQVKALENERNALLDAKQSVEGQLCEAHKTISSYKSKVTELEGKAADVDKRIELARSYSAQELEKNKQELIMLKGQLDYVQKQLSGKEAQYNSLIQTIGMNESGVQSLLENNKTMDEINRTLRDQIVMLKNDLEKARKDAAFAKQTAATLEESNRNMRVSMKAMTVGMSGGVSASSGIAPFSYQGKGMVIPVFGCGSFGITTTAMSIATKLSAQARVLYIDFDMVAPKADGWFKINPMIRNVPDIDLNSAKTTALGLFVDKQIQYFLSNASSLILKPIQTKSGCIDYIGGFYAKPDTIKLMSADFGSFLNFCGNNYTYVVIDFGRLGSSDINDQIIKAFSDVAYRSVVVTTSDKFEIRTFRMKLAEARIDVTNIAWMINMCERTNLEDTAKKSISPALYSLMPFNSEIYGKRMDFTKDRLTRDKLALFMEKVLFRK